MIEPTDKEKIGALERILKSITYADEIRYKKYGKEMEWFYVIFVGARPNHLRLRGYSEGLYISWDAEPYEVEPPSEEFLPTQVARLLGEVWIQNDPRKIIEELEKKIQSLSEKVKEKNEND